jgi:hypothetical protein
LMRAFWRWRSNVTTLVTNEGDTDETCADIVVVDVVTVVK